MSLFSKQNEIELLQALLEGNGYFADKFRNDIPVMIENIKKDFPIETGTSIEKAETEHVREKEQLLQNYENETRLLKKDHEASLQDMYAYLLKTEDETLYNKVVADLGIEKTIKLKRKVQLSLSENEIDYLVSKLS
jgi:hypothetical protein